MKRAAAWFAIITFMALPAHTQPRDAGEVVTRHVTATEGQLLLVRNYAMWRSDCSPRGEPVVTITAQPQHGTVTVRPGMAMVREYVGEGSNCVGRQMPGMAVWYQAAPGYWGADQFALTINTSHTLRDLVVVTVR